MYKHPSKRNTLNNISNIEDLALNVQTPMDIMEAVEDDKKFELLLEDIIKLGDLNKIDILVLGGLKSRKQAAKELNVKYGTYTKKLWRKVQRIRENKEDD